MGFMETETLCDCRQVDHSPTCPDSPEVYECCICGELYDPEDTFNFDACVDDHCDECRRRCPMCSRQREFV